MLEGCELLKVGLFLGPFHYPILEREDRGGSVECSFNSRVRGGDEGCGKGVSQSLKTGSLLRDPHRYLLVKKENLLNIKMWYCIT